jgi:AraC-like DNA-binding protein|tara:strand:- start:17647 stop:18060 length:414 start_codon:yes stop_codon:yes gene_type:complete
LIQTAVEIRPKRQIEKEPNSAANRISTDFMELLENQFPVADQNYTLKLRSASDFAQKLNIHVNHLNRSLKAILNKSTSIINRDRKVAEAKRLLGQTDWSVSEIAYCLGFTEVPHFNNFFKRVLNMNPSLYRKLLNKN